MVTNIEGILVNLANMSKQYCGNIAQIVSAIWDMASTISI